MSGQAAVVVTRSRLSLLGDSQSVRLAKTWRREFSGTQLETGSAVSGWTTGQLRKSVLERVSVLETNCFIFIGVNDILKKVPYEDMVKNFKSIIKTLHYFKKRMLISTLPPILSSTPEQTDKIKNFNVFVLSFNTHSAVTVIPFHSMFPPFAELRLEFYQLRYYSGKKDYVHLSILGLRALMGLVNSANDKFT